MTKEQELDLIIDVSTDFWNELIAEHGSIYVDKHHNEYVQELKQVLHEAIIEAHKEEALAKQEWLDSYYNDPYVQLGARQQDLIDLYRFER